ncbi:hypothetical protein IV487_02305 [Enterococcus saccharolyticus]|uniref:N-acetyltransferase domain-containing protein n=1 Tax=Candidatus Enterococcus willemsii TaxID=1857215 RepID=A0ABQ6Z0N2_9ENTE|nr:MULTISPECIES: hypothetical protein [Enterococcus]KAF1304562.1 hypothetical protein BAU17_10195 [Enterococcus sp. CU12B]MCD5001297.1 hypothetical protein [Enterococcus saccharolyticus]
MSILHQQFAIDFACSEEVFTKEKNFFTTNHATMASRRNAREFGAIVCYNNQLFVRTESEPVTEALHKTFKDTSGAWFLEFESIQNLTDLLAKYQLKIAKIRPFFIPKVIGTPLVDSRFRFLSEQEIPIFKQDKRIVNAFEYLPEEPDKIGYGYFDPTLKAIAGANTNGAYTWELGIEILSDDLRAKGVATKLIQGITTRIQEMEPTILPIYSTAWSHNRSLNVAIRAGYQMGWSEVVIVRDN